MHDPRRYILAAGLAVAALATVFYAGMAVAADTRLSEADAATQKAIALLRASENPGVEPPFGSHRSKAVKALKEARAEIALAIEYADNSQPEP